MQVLQERYADISIHKALAGLDGDNVRAYKVSKISIHKALAGLDKKPSMITITWYRFQSTLNFYIHLAQNILLNIFNLDSFLYDVHKFWSVSFAIA